VNAEASDLDQLLNEALEVPKEGSPAKWPSGAARGIAKVKYTHDAMIDLIIANPCVSQGQLALHFGYTQGWVSQVISSDAFQMRLAERKDELVDPTIRQSIEDNFKALVLRSMDILREKLNKPADAISDTLALRTLELASRAAGYGTKIQVEAKSQVDVHHHLESLGDNLVDLLRRKKSEVYDVDAQLVSESEK
jgi:hypothetical protein